ncbi:hypothetical protein [Sphingomonas azotifigens]|uniref:hypothetical protein n=1 Tax=Sphingomonas azotifigens TaxID=330920 RepID=UPI0014306B54|nr:hypothetical protein [Sphingomonas azotifigens]
MFEIDIVPPSLLSWVVLAGITLFIAAAATGIIGPRRHAKQQRDRQPSDAKTGDDR